MSYEIITKFDSKNYQKGRKEKVKFIVIHHWGADGQKFDNVVRYLCTNNKQTSAHYVVEAGRVACIVDPDNTAWHAVSGNAAGIGIECRPEMDAGDFETVAELIAELRAVYGDIPLYPHKKFVATACPGRWEARLSDLDARARAIAQERNKKKEPVKQVTLSPAGEPDEARLVGCRRLYNPALSRHLYTIDEKEALALLSQGWTDEGVKFFVYPSKA